MTDPIPSEIRCELCGNLKKDHELVAGIKWCLGTANPFKPIPSVSPASPKSPTQMDWLIGSLTYGQICTDYLESVKFPASGVAHSYANEAAFYAFRAFPELRELSPASTKEEK